MDRVVGWTTLEAGDISSGLQSGGKNAGLEADG